VGLNKLIKLILVFSFFSAVNVHVFSVPLESLSPSYAQRLRSGGEIIIEAQLRNPAPVLLPSDNDLRRIVSGVLNALNPNIMIESLSLYDKPAGYHTDAGTWDVTQRTAVFNQTLALSTLTGIQYYSASRRQMRTFYEFSGIINNPQARSPVPDPVFRQPQDASFHVRQRDLTFGDNIYRYDYTAAGEAIIFTQENTTTLSYGIIPLINRGNLRSIMAVFDCGDSILVYSVSMVKALSFPGLNDRIRDSFTTRAEAVLGWFTGRLDREVFTR